MEPFPIVSKEPPGRAHEALPTQNQEAGRDGVVAERRRQRGWSRPHDAHGVQR